jgi:hypothetical protein
MKDINIPTGGLYARAVTVSHSAITGISKKDGSRWVRIQHELATQPGLVVLEQYCDPAKYPDIKIKGDTLAQSAARLRGTRADVYHLRPALRGQRRPPRSALRLLALGPKPRRGPR